MSPKKISFRVSADKNPQVKEYTTAIRLGAKAQHVTPHNGDWQVKKASSLTATKVFSTQKEAIKFARDLAIKQKTELIVHGKDGRIRERNSYGNDPFPPRG